MSFITVAIVFAYCQWNKKQNYTGYMKLKQNYQVEKTETSENKCSAACQ